MSTPVLAFPKPSRLKDPAYLAWIKAQPCLICRTSADPHHTPSVGAGGSDYRALPLCRKHHQECHRAGKVTFQKRHNVDFKDEMLRLLETYIAAGREAT